jgi:hypothetical protein
MSEPVSRLIIELVTWVSSRRRTYAEAMEAWRSNCPRHSVWEDAIAEGLIQLEGEGDIRQAEVTLTPRGKAILAGIEGRPALPADRDAGA